LCRDAIHETADGRRLLVIHGDEYDAIIAHAKWLAHLGDTAYVVALQVSNWLHQIRTLFGLRYWSLSQYLKTKVKKAVQFISNFEEAMVRAAHSAGAHGVVCGHIHHPMIRDMGGVLYCNDGDWVENCSALVEDGMGRLRLIYWTETQGDRREVRERSLPSSLPARELDLAPV
jgi:UDP-2,3-diacylglucosamine pyrophosphatase LpxH